MIYQLGNKRPQFNPDSSFIASSADIIGDVVLHEQTSVWFNAVIRGDTDRIEIGAESNIQDNATLHTDPGIPLRVGKGVTVGHQVMLHGCSVGDHSLIGINSVVLNNAVIGECVLIGANTLITEGKTIPSGVMVLGNPGKVVRELTEQEQNSLRQAASVYTAKIPTYQQGLKSLA